LEAGSRLEQGVICLGWRSAQGVISLDWSLVGGQRHNHTTTIPPPPPSTTTTWLEVEARGNKIPCGVGGRFEAVGGWLEVGWRLAGVWSKG